MPLACMSALSRRDAGIPLAATTAIGLTSKSEAHALGAFGSTATMACNEERPMRKPLTAAIKRTGDSEICVFGRAIRNAECIRTDGRSRTSSLCGDTRPDERTVKSARNETPSNLGKRRVAPAAAITHSEQY